MRQPFAAPLLMIAFSAATVTLAAPMPTAAAPLRGAVPARKTAPTKTVSPDPRVVALLQRVQAAYRRTDTLSADFTYVVTSVKRQQVVDGTVQLKKPNLARVTFSYLREPGFPSLIASDGRNMYTFTPESYDTETHRFRSLPFDPVVGAKQASGALPGGGTITAIPVAPDGTNLRLWDAAPIQAFFDPLSAIRRTLYIEDPRLLRYEGTKTINGVPYRILRHFLPNGNIAGGEETPFEQRLYIGPDDLIHQYVLEFRSGGRPGIQVVKLQNIRTNEPVEEGTFAFTPPGTGETPQQ